MKIVQTRIEGVVIVETTPVEDARGSFARLFCDGELAGILGGRRIVQVNRSRTRAAGALRGLHLQRPPHAEMKLVRCTKGSVYDVAVDLRCGSPTFLEWVSETLSEENERMLVVSEGCAHGFQTLEPETDLLYLHTAAYAPGAEGGFAFDDPRLRIAWPLPVTEVSPRDRSHGWIYESFTGIRL